MTTTNIFELGDDLRIFGFWYCVWRKHSLWDIFVAYRMNKHALDAMVNEWGGQA